LPSKSIVTNLNRQHGLSLCYQEAVRHEDVHQDYLKLMM